MELHKEIGIWLSKFKLISPDSIVLAQNAEIHDLIAIIRDGVVLCQVSKSTFSKIELALWGVI